MTDELDSILAKGDLERETEADAKELREGLWQALQEVGWHLDMLRTLGVRSNEEDKLSRAADWVIFEMEGRLEGASGIEAGTATTEGRGAEPESPTTVGGDAKGL